MFKEENEYPCLEERIHNKRLELVEEYCKKNNLKMYFTLDHISKWRLPILDPIQLGSHHLNEIRKLLRQNN